MQIQVNKNNFITGYALVGGFYNGITVPISYINYLNKDKLGFIIYKGTTNKPVLDEKSYKQYIKQLETKKIISQRDSIIVKLENKCPLWWKKLTNEQNKEIEEYYDKLMEVENTLTIPSKPQWFKL